MVVFSCLLPVFSVFIKIDSYTDLLVLYCTVHVPFAQRACYVPSTHDRALRSLLRHYTDMTNGVNQWERPECLPPPPRDRQEKDATKATAEGEVETKESEDRPRDRSGDRWREGQQRGGLDDRGEDGRDSRRERDDWQRMEWQNRGSRRDDSPYSSSSSSERRSKTASSTVCSPHKTAKCCCALLLTMCFHSSHVSLPTCMFFDAEVGFQALVLCCLLCGRTSGDVSSTLSRFENGVRGQPRLEDRSVSHHLMSCPPFVAPLSWHVTPHIYFSTSCFSRGGRHWRLVRTCIRCYIFSRTILYDPPPLPPLHPPLPPILYLAPSNIQREKPQVEYFRYKCYSPEGDP